MPHTIDHTVRVLDQEIDAVVVCSGHTDHIVVATYSLVKSEPVAETGDVEEDGERPHEISRRTGSLQILPIEFDASLSPTEPSSLCRTRKDFPCAVLDVRFHPTVTDLLGAATSTGEVRFFEIVWPSSGASCKNDEVQIVPLGKVQVADDTGTTLITQFVWIDVPQTTSLTSHDAGRMVCLATCDTTGQVKLIRVSVPLASPHSKTEDVSSDDCVLPCETVDVHKHLHDLEAWTVIFIPLANTTSSQQMILSGGDDSSLIASTLTIDTASTASQQLLVDSPVRIHLDRRTHSAGVVSILPLKPTINNSVPILTGSYDQNLRLVMFKPVTNSFTTVTQLELEGGVWRISLLTTYMDGSDVAGQSRDWILLVSAMHAGCYVVRLRLTRVSDAPVWTWDVETIFREPHESMVYACAAVEDIEQTGRWTIVSTSFYDRRLCVWKWTDPKRDNQPH